MRQNYGSLTYQRGSNWLEYIMHVQWKYNQNYLLLHLVLIKHNLEIFLEKCQLHL